MKYGLIEAQGEIRLHDGDNSNYVSLNSPAVVPANYSISFPTALPPSTSFLSLTATGDMGYSTAVTSVGLAMPAIFTVGGSPITDSGTFTVSLNTQAAGTIFAGPVTGADAVPSFRGIEITDFSTLPALDEWDVPTGSVDFNGVSLINVGVPVNGSDAATKSYVDAAIQGLDTLDSVRYATTADIASILTANAATAQAALNTVGGSAPALQTGDRVLVKNQTDASENGIYVWNGSALERAADADEASEVGPGAFVFVEEGDQLGDSGWVLSADQPFTLGTDPATWQQFSGAGQITAGAGLVKSGNELNIQTADAGRIVVNADNIDLAQTPVAPGTYTSVTVDDYGRVTEGTNPVSVSSYTQTFVDADLTVGAITITHNLGQKFPSVVIADSTDCLLQPDQILFTDANELQIDMTSYGTIIGTYTVTLYA